MVDCCRIIYNININHSLEEWFFKGKMGNRLEGAKNFVIRTVIAGTALFGAGLSVACAGSEPPKSPNALPATTPIASKPDTNTATRPAVAPIVKPSLTATPDRTDLSKDKMRRMNIEGVGQEINLSEDLIQRFGPERTANIVQAVKDYNSKIGLIVPIAFKIDNVGDEVVVINGVKYAYSEMAFPGLVILDPRIIDSKVSTTDPVKRLEELKRLDREIVLHALTHSNVKRPNQQSMNQIWYGRDRFLISTMGLGFKMYNTDFPNGTEVGVFEEGLAEMLATFVDPTYRPSTTMYDNFRFFYMKIFPSDTSKKYAAKMVQETNLNAFIASFCNLNIMEVKPEHYNVALNVLYTLINLGNNPGARDKMWQDFNRMRQAKKFSMSYQQLDQEVIENLQFWQTVSSGKIADIHPQTIAKHFNDLVTQQDNLKYQLQRSRGAHKKTKKQIEQLNAQLNDTWAKIELIAEQMKAHQVEAYANSTGLGALPVAA